MVHPRSLSIQEPHPDCTEWRCELHGVLPRGEVECPECRDDQS